MQIRNSVVYDASKGSLYKYCNKRYIVWQRWDNVNSQTGVALPVYFQANLSEWKVMWR